MYIEYESHEGEKKGIKDVNEKYRVCYIIDKKKKPEKW